ncbi:hypothetical protein HFC70_11405 [Agrobacterium sp. a22-2]|uniref:COG4223 family protein n=1 Tax=Agrobacterium sp. a22-2 TaxID=2283840 RepID=UPI0014451D52|nr:hypothetical protein [Agrobacterium sp. a22-2]NKN36961.1 hypothetical protein [Agrobacterium sp. a22-2]
MVSEKTPRRSKTTTDPVTIDLQATASDPVETVSEPIPPATDAGAATEPPVDIQPASDDVPGPAPEMAADVAAEAGTASENTDFLQANAAPEPDDAKPEPTVTPVRPAQSSSSTASLAAAGIFGGLVALAGAGAMQYAGFIPGLSPDSGASVSALSSEVSSLKTQIGSLSGAAPMDNTAIEGRIAALEAALAAQPDNAADATAVEDLQARLNQTSDALTALQSQVAGTASALSDSETRLGDKLTQIETKLDQPRDDIEVARAIAASALKTATDRGGPFLSELETYAGIAPEEPALADLRSFATIGIQSRSQLIRDVTAVTTGIVEAVNQPDPEQGWSGRLLSSAKSLVKVRPVGSVEGDSVEAVAARFEDKLKNGDLKGAASEWNALPEPGKQASAAFKAQLDARIKVEDLVGTIMAKAVAGRQG